MDNDEAMYPPDDPNLSSLERQRLALKDNIAAVQAELSITMIMIQTFLLPV